MALAAVESLEAGNEDQAKPELEAALRVDPNGKLVLNLLKQISADPQEALGRESFSYTVAHDLRAPLRSINGFVSLLELENASQLNAQGRQFLERIKNGAASMNALIEGLLSLSRLGREPLWPVPVDLSALAQSVAREMQERDPARRVEFVIHPGIEAVADLHLVKDVLDNLIGNAWKFTSGKAQARIEFGSTTHQDGVAYFVRDDGAGFDPDYADKLFGTFQRLHTGEEFPGIGIGLASVKRIIENHGGKVWAEGAVGQGATFWFTLSVPLVAPDA